ncbi:hypothetical protein EDB89DRAFT_1916595 [Lactarius sanguifluus]|nr:hypothetical protein EDB89DRAFT_1916595 [Lactarius sanguifluus]
MISRAVQGLVLRNLMPGTTAQDWLGSGLTGPSLTGLSNQTLCWLLAQRRQQQHGEYPRALTHTASGYDDMGDGGSCVTITRIVRNTSLITLVIPEGAQLTRKCQHTGNLTGTVSWQPAHHRRHNNHNSDNNLIATGQLGRQLGCDDDNEDDDCNDDDKDDDCDDDDTGNNCDNDDMGDDIDDNDGGDDDNDGGDDEGGNNCGGDDSGGDDSGDDDGDNTL